MSCGRLSLSSTPLGLISSACLQREGDLLGLIITQATTSSQPSVRLLHTHNLHKSRARDRSDDRVTKFLCIKQRRGGLVQLLSRNFLCIEQTTGGLVQADLIRPHMAPATPHLV